MLLSRSWKTGVSRYLGPGFRYLDAFLLAAETAVEGLMRLSILKNGDIEAVPNRGLLEPGFHTV